MLSSSQESQLERIFIAFLTRAEMQSMAFFSSITTPCIYRPSYLIAKRPAMDQIHMDGFFSVNWLAAGQSVSWKQYTSRKVTFLWKSGASLYPALHSPRVPTGRHFFSEAADPGPNPPGRVLHKVAATAPNHHRLPPSDSDEPRAHAAARRPPAVLIAGLRCFRRMLQCSIKGAHAGARHLPRSILPGHERPLSRFAHRPAV